LLAEARSALRSIERIHEHCAGWSGLESGRLRIGSVASAAAKLLPSRLRVFQTRYPKVNVTLLEGSDAEVRDWALLEAVDIGFTAELASELEHRVIAEDDFLIVASTRHHRALRSTLSVRDISELPFIMSGAGCEPEIRSMFAANGCDPRVAFTVRDMATLLEMVRQGLGVSAVPALSLPDDRTGLRVLKPDPPHRRKLLMVTKRQAHPTPAALVFVEFFGSGAVATKAGNRDKKSARKPTAVHRN
jgi:DNA-binding transcriptional LysR family regulator